MMTLAECLEANPVPQFTYTKSFDEARHEPFVALHTSGSTGLPKLVVPTHGSLTACDTFQLMPKQGHAPVMVEAIRGKRLFLGLPPFHSAGVFMLLAMTLYYDVTPVLGPPVPLTANILDQIHEHANVKVSCVAPSIIEDIVKVPSYLERLENLDYIMYGGGPLAKEAGDRAIEKTTVISLIGSTETMLLPTELADKEDWQYYGFSPCLGAEFRNLWGNLHEMVILRKPELELSQAIFQTYPDVQEYSMKDVYSPHPTKVGLWLYRGRSDDIIVFSNGEKMNPVTMEGMISMHSAVCVALIVGAGRFQPSLLVEPKQPPRSTSEKEALIDSLWPTVKRANQDAPAYGRVARDLILFTDPDKPMLRAGKGTVQRQATERLYMAELNSLNTAGGGLSMQGSDSRLASPDLEQLLKKVLLQELDVDDLESEADLFTLGLDSLKLTNIVRYVNASLNRTGCVSRRLAPKDLYSNPTLGQLAFALQGKSTGSESNGDSAGKPRDRVKQMKSLAAQYAQDLPVTGRQPRTRHSSDPKNVILTGSTGSLGSYLFDALLADATVGKIYCLNRTSKVSAVDRQRRIMKTKGLVSGFPSAKVSFLETDFSQPYFGLPRYKYAELLHDVTHILHNAWEVNFNLSLRSFEPHILGVRRFIDFCSQSRFGASIFFTSTIGTVMGWTAQHTEPTPEKLIDDWCLPQHTGYAESKFICEQLLAEASSVSGVDAVVCRIGQVAGPTTTEGRWSEKEWFPSIIASSVDLRIVPKDLGPMEAVDWLPVDVLAKVIMELYIDRETTIPRQFMSSNSHYGNTDSVDSATHPLLNSNMESDASPYLPSMKASQQGELSGVVDGTATICEVHHTVNPHKTTYSELLPTFLTHLPDGIKPVTLKEWVGQLEESQDELHGNSATRLLEFYQDMVRMEERGQRTVSLSTYKTMQRSPTLKNIGAVSPTWMSGWIRQWSFQRDSSHRYEDRHC